MHMKDYYINPINLFKRVLHHCADDMLHALMLRLYVNKTSSSAQSRDNKYPPEQAYIETCLLTSGFYEHHVVSLSFRTFQTLCKNIVPLYVRNSNDSNFIFVFYQPSPSKKHEDSLKLVLLTLPPVSCTT